MTSSEELKRLTQRFAVEPWGTGNFAAIDELCAPEYRMGELTADALKQLIREYRQAIPDLQIDISEMIVEGDNVAYRWVMAGTHLGEYHGVAPTGRTVSATGITMLRYRDGQIVRDVFESGSKSIDEQIS